MSSPSLPVPATAPAAAPARRARPITALLTRIAEAIGAAEARAQGLRPAER